MGKPAILYIDYASTATFTATDTISGRSVDDVANATEDEFWQPADQTGTKTITIDLGSAIQLDHSCLLGSDMGGVSLTVQTDDNSGFSSPTTRFTGTISSELNSAVIVHTASSTERYIRYQFSGMSADFKIAHIAPDKLVELPTFEQDWGSEGIDADFVSLVTDTGFYTGGITRKAMRNISLNWGDVTTAEFTTLSTFIEDRVKTPGAFFFVPYVDTKTENYFCWLESNEGLTAPLRLGIRTLSPINCKTRIR
jgi:hypothetical protein